MSNARTCCAPVAAESVVRQHVTIIGCGAAAVVMLSRLLELGRHVVAQVTIVGTEEPMGVGLAYGTLEASHLLNLPAQSMSIPGWESFPAWLGRTRDFSAMQRAAYVPRHLFGGYLREAWSAFLARAEMVGIAVRVLRDRVVAVRCEGKQLAVRTSAHGILPSDAVILCTGHLPPHTYEHLQGATGYLASPWPFRNVHERVKPQDRCAILGCRLSAVDVALGLLSHGHKGALYFVSRNGALPRVKGALQPYKLRVLDIQALRAHNQVIDLDTLIDMYRAELSLAYGRNIAALKRPSYTRDADWWRSEIAKAAKPRIWQNVLEQVYNIATDLWQLLSYGDQQRFLDKHFEQWMVHVASLPIETATSLLAPTQQGRLTSLSGIEAVEPDAQAGGFRLHLRDRAPVGVDAVVNATGSSHQVSLAKDPLLRQLLRDKLVTENPLGGIFVDAETLQSGGKRGPALYALGELTFGSCLTVSDFPCIIRQAAKVAQHLQSQAGLCRSQLWTAA